MTPLFLLSKVNQLLPSSDRWIRSLFPLIPFLSMENESGAHPAFPAVASVGVPEVELQNSPQRIQTRRIEVLAAFAILLQLGDYICTTIGIDRVGIAAEGNPMVRNAMAAFGHVPVLILTKCTAMLMVAVLVLHASSTRRTESMLVIICLVYLFAVVGPWIYVLLYLI